jgi:TolA-binding protein
MTHLSSDSVVIATLVVTIIAAFAAVHRELRPVIRVFASLILSIVAIWLIAAIINSIRGNEKTDPAPNTNPPTVTNPPTITYPPPPEPTIGTSAITATTSTVPTATSTQSTSGITKTTQTQRPVEPLPPTPMPVTPKLDTVELRPERPPSVTDARVVYERQVKRALALDNLGDWRGAADAWGQLIRDYAGQNRAFDASAYYHLGTAYKQLSDWSRAADAFEKAVDNDNRKDAIRDLKILGACYIKLHRRDDAMTVYKRLIGIDPNDRVSRDLLTVLSRQP